MSRRTGADILAPTISRLLASVLLVSPLPVAACGFEDPATINLGALNFAYPDSLHVGTAAWQAERAGLLRTPEKSAAPAQWQALRQLHELARRAGTRGVQLPGLAIVLLPAVFWSRLVPDAGSYRLLPHVASPEAGDRVLVTTTEALAAWFESRIGSGELGSRGLLRYYGPQEERAVLMGELAKLDGPGEASPR